MPACPLSFLETPNREPVRTMSRVTKQAKPSQRHQPPTTPTSPLPSSMASILASIATPATNWVAGVGKVERLLRGRPLNLVCALVGVAGGQSFKICGPNSAQGCKKTVASWNRATRGFGLGSTRTSSRD
ncbi:hypothetical protein VTJ04DRAFT_10108 [Mycothermus thermophilus]|uniref:uncharacterized protein n=1 Tax=Humicola insolens TaxID=85995 RepID=UPI003743AFAF